MQHEITLTGYTQAPTGQVQVDFNWNGQVMSKVFNTEDELVATNLDLIQSPDEAARFLLCYLLTLAGGAAAPLPGFVGKKLTANIDVAVAQTVSLT